MAARFVNTLFPLTFFFLLGAFTPPAPARPADPAIEATAGAVCIDPWQRPQPCRSASPRNDSANRSAADRWWRDLWTTAGEVAASPQFILGGRPVSCGATFDPNPLLKLDFTSFQLNMDVNLDAAEERFDSLRIGWRSCWRWAGVFPFPGDRERQDAPPKTDLSLPAGHGIMAA